MTTLTASSNVGGGGVESTSGSRSSSSSSFLHHHRRRYATSTNRRKQRMLRRTQSDHHEEENGHSDDVDSRYHRAVAFMQHFRHSHSLDIVDEDSPLGEKQRTLKRSETTSCLQSLGSLEEQSHVLHHDDLFSFSSANTAMVSSHKHMMTIAPRTPAIVEYDDCDVVMVQLNDEPSFRSTR